MKYIIESQLIFAMNDNTINSLNRDEIKISNH